MKLTILSRYDDMGASSRMRMLQYLPYFSAAGIDATVFPLFSNSDLSRRYKRGSYGALKIAHKYFNRIITMWHNRSDLIWIEKELIPWVPAWFENFLLRGRQYVLDFDDAIFHDYDRHRFGVVRTLLGQKIDRLMKNANLIIAGNDYLANRAISAGCQRVEIVPTVIDLNRYPLSVNPNRNGQDDPVVVGWIGSPYTTRYLKMLETPLATLSREKNIRLRVIGGGPIELPGVAIESHAWKEAEEANLLAGCDIGIMPLPDSPFEKGKCGYKLVQYMACSKPVIGSPVGVNSKIVTSDCGFLCTSDDEWLTALSKLTADWELRSQMGKAGRTIVEESYCVQKTGPRIVSLFQDLNVQPTLTH